MNPDKDKTEDVDPLRGTSSSGGRRNQRPRNSQFPNGNGNWPTVNDHNRDNLPQQQAPPPPLPPQDFCQRLPWHMHRHGAENPFPSKPPPPQQWQYFTRFRPFGESARPYQFPPPPRFPQQFQFRTFPGRSPRVCHRRENMSSRAVNSSNTNNNDIQPEGALHNNYPGIPHGDVRPKTGAFFNGRKKFNKSKHHPHDSSRSSKNKKDNSKPNTTSLHCADVGDNRGERKSPGVSDSSKENAFLVEDNDSIKISKSCDESWFNNVCNENSFGLKAEQCEAQEVVEEGAVGGVPLNVEGVQEGNDFPPLLDKDLFDEGAIFDLDKVFLNHEISRKRDSHFTNGLDSEDDLDLVFDYESKKCDETALSDVEPPRFVHGREASSAAYSSTVPWGDNKRDLNCTFDNSNSFVNTSDGNRHVIHFQSVQNNENSNDNNNIIIYNGRHGSADSDGGEDTGDFIDTDLPSHVKHILSSSDEMDNQSSSKESDDDDYRETKRETKLQAAIWDKEKSNSDVNSNDLSTLEPRLLNSLSHLSMTTDGRTNGASNQCNGEKGTYCDLEEEFLSSSAGSSHVEKNSKRTSKCRCDVNSQLGDRRAHPSSPSNHLVRSNAASSTVHGAASHNFPSVDLASFPNHLGVDCVYPSSSDHSWRVNDSINTHCHHHNHRRFLTANAQSELPSCSQALNPHCPFCQSDPNDSGTSSTEKGAGCSRCFTPQSHSVASTVGSAYHHHNNHDSNAANGAGHSLADSNCPQACSSSALAAESERELNSNTAPPQQQPHALNMDSSSSSSSSSSVAGGMEDPMLSFDNLGDQVDMVLLPMEEEIEPVLSGGGAVGGDMGSDFDIDEEDVSRGVRPQALMRPIGNANTPHRRPLSGQPPRFEEYHEPHTRDSMSGGNRLPSKEFYVLIKTVRSTDSYMQFFDKDGQDVQRSAQKTSNDEITTSTAKRGNKQAKRSSGPRGDCLKVDRVMIWNEYEAYVVQYKQIAVSACGQTAVLNVLKALKFQCLKSLVCKVIKTNFRKDDKDIPEYLFSRMCAGTTAVELIAGIEKLTEGVIGGRFFHFWPSRKVKLLQWLAYWMKRGAIPMATLNLQQGPHSVWEVPDSWHHQMVYGVSHQGLYLTNPLEIVSERSAIKQLHSDSVLLVKRQDIISRFRESTDLGLLLEHPDPRWMSMNVIGQVVNVLRECNMPSVPGYRLQVTSHIKIPASYQAGITLFMRKDQPAWDALRTAPELPLE